LAVLNAIQCKPRGLVDSQDIDRPDVLARVAINPDIAWPPRTVASFCSAPQKNARLAIMGFAEDRLQDCII
jgi:hypothetical protein